MHGNELANGVDDRGQKFFVIPLATDRMDERVYWLNVSIVFSYKFLKYRLIGVSLKVFTGPDLVSQEKALIFRAEWDHFEQTSQSDHAQPHWHFHYLPDIDLAQFMEPRTIDLKKMVDVETEEAPDDTMDNSQIHFAMCAEWFKNNNCRTSIKDEAQFKSWLDHCLHYITTQLR